MASVNSLPNEILCSIFQHVFLIASSRKASLKGSRALYRIIKVSRRWHSLGIPILYSKISFKDVQDAILYIEALFHYHPHYAAYAKVLDFSTVRLPPVFAKRLASFTFSDLTQLSIHPDLSQYLQDKAAMPVSQLQRLNFAGLGDPDVMDRYSKTLKSLAMQWETVSPESALRNLPSQPLPRLQKLELAYRVGCAPALQKLRSLLPGLTHLLLHVMPDVHATAGSRLATQEGLQALLSELRDQLQFLDIDVSHFQETWVLGACRLDGSRTLTTFIYRGAVPTRWLNLLKSLPISLQHITIDCEVMRAEDLNYILEMIAGSERFPNLVTIPDIRVLNLSGYHHDVPDPNRRRDAAWRALRARGLQWDESSCGDGCSVWKVDLEELAYASSDGTSDSSDGSWVD